MNSLLWCRGRWERWRVGEALRVPIDLLLLLLLLLLLVQVLLIHVLLLIHLLLIKLIVLLLLLIRRLLVHVRRWLRQIGKCCNRRLLWLLMWCDRLIVL